MKHTLLSNVMQIQIKVVKLSLSIMKFMRISNSMSKWRFSSLCSWNGHVAPPPIMLTIKPIISIIFCTQNPKSFEHNLGHKVFLVSILGATLIQILLKYRWWINKSNQVRDNTLKLMLHLVEVAKFWHCSIYGQTTCPKIIRDMHLWGQT